MESRNVATVSLIAEYHREKRVSSNGKRSEQEASTAVERLEMVSYEADRCLQESADDARAAFGTALWLVNEVFSEGRQAVVWWFGGFETLIADLKRILRVGVIFRRVVEAKAPIVVEGVLSAKKSRGIRARPTSNVSLRTSKIDRTIVRSLDRNPRDWAIVSATVTMVHALGLPAVTEGVNTKRKTFELRALGRGLGQGPYWWRPRGAGAMEELLATHAV
jgi:EAL domain-containing protein